MNRTIPYYIRRILIERRSVYVPNIGQFSMYHHSAKVGTYNRYIFPPSSSIVFDKNCRPNDYLINWVADCEGIDKNAAQIKVQEYSQTLIDRLLIANDAYIENVGRLQKEHNNVIFKSEFSSPDSPSGLSKIRIIPVSRFSKQTVKTYPVEKKGFDWKPILVGFLLGLFFIILLSLIRKYTSETPLMSDVKPEYIEYSEASIADTSSKITSYNEYHQVIPLSGNCIIIVGSFSHPDHVDNMAKLITSKGYEAYIEPYYDLTRVGVKFSCRNQDLESFIHQVREDFNSKAWYLDPDIDVAYAE